ncbi:MAG: hypothetical protein JXA54_09320 [Candidatus Heimdallarchaeota archaeon]|nr:hypothetical protein [Candidatus Heimdallarchaeota archaeon]
MNYIVSSEKRQAYIIKLPDNIGNEIQFALANNQVNLGWVEAKGLTNDQLENEDFREIIHDAYHPHENDYRSSGRKAGNAWRFIHEMKRGNYVLIPSEKGMYIGKVESEPFYEEGFIAIHSGYKRRVRWLNNRQPIPKMKIPRRLRSKLSSNTKVTNIDNLIQEIEFALRVT